MNAMALPSPPPLTFGTAGLRGPMRDGPDGMNVETVTRASWALAKVLKDRCLAGSTVVVGRDARHQSDDFALATAEVLAAEGFSVILLPDAAPTPVVAFAVRHLRAAAGVQITASHNPPADNGYKVYLDGGMQIVPPTDRDIEAAMMTAPSDADRVEVSPADTEVMHDYVRRAAGVRRTTGDVRVALTPMHGVGGEIALRVLREAGITDVHTVAEQFAPDPDFPTVAFPNPEEPGATDLLLALAGEVDADVAIALDPDADRCAVAIPTPTGWRMLSGDETGWLLGDYVLSQTEPGDVMAASVVASTVVSSRMLAADRREPRRPARRDADGLQVAGARRLRVARRHAGLRLRGGHRALRRSGRGARQGRHHRGRSGVRPRRRPAARRPHPARCARRAGRWHTACTRRPRCRCPRTTA